MGGGVIQPDCKKAPVSPDQGQGQSSQAVKLPDPCPYWAHHALRWLGDAKDSGWDHLLDLAADHLLRRHSPEEAKRLGGNIRRWLAQGEGRTRAEVRRYARTKLRQTREMLEEMTWAERS